MRKIILLALMLTGCLVRGGPERTVVRERACPPGQHWDDGRCERNGHGHDKDEKHGEHGEHHGHDRD